MSLLKCADGGRYPVDVRVGQSWMKRQRQDFLRAARRDGVVAPRRRERGLARQRHGIVNEGLDARCAQMRLKRIALGRAHHEQMVRVAIVALLERLYPSTTLGAPGARERAAVRRREKTAPIRPAP